MIGWFFTCIEQKQESLSASAQYPARQPLDSEASQLLDDEAMV